MLPDRLPQHIKCDRLPPQRLAAAAAAAMPPLQLLPLLLMLLLLPAAACCYPYTASDKALVQGIEVTTNVRGSGVTIPSQ
jgi:hypothetical protein